MRNNSFPQASGRGDALAELFCVKTALISQNTAFFWKNKYLAGSGASYEVVKVLERTAERSPSCRVYYRTIVLFCQIEES
jgi:hypothetical protein